MFILIEALFWFVAETPRARLNVTQFVSILFFVILTLHLRSLHPEAESAPGSARESIILPGLAIMSGMIVWGTMLAFYFLGDDYLLVGMARTPMLSLMASVFRHGDGGVFYRPLTFMSYAWDHAIWGEGPFGYHLTNLTLHFVSVIGLFALLRQLGVTRRVSAITSGIFAAMPIQAEAVAWMSGRFDVLSTTLTLWTIALYLRARSKNSVASYLLAMLLFVLAIGSKESAFVLPLLLIAIEFMVLRTRPNWRVAGFILLGVLGFVYRLFALGGIGGYHSGGSHSVYDFGLKTLEGLFIRGPSQLLFGINWLQPGAISATLLASLIALLLMVLVFGGAPDRGQKAIIGFALIWMIVAMVPGHFLLLIGSGLSNSRILYLPSVGIAIVLGHLLDTLNGRRFQNAVFVALIAVLNLGVLHNLAAWRWTSGLAERTLQSVVELEPSPASHTQFIFPDIPDTVRGVFFFRTGLSMGLKMVYGRDDIDAVRGDETPAPLRPQIRLLWKNGPDALLERQ